MIAWFAFLVKSALPGDGLNALALQIIRQTHLACPPGPASQVQAGQVSRIDTKNKKNLSENPCNSWQRKRYFPPRILRLRSGQVARIDTKKTLVLIRAIRGKTTGGEAWQI